MKDCILYPQTHHPPGGNKHISVPQYWLSCSLHKVIIFSVSFRGKKRAHHPFWYTILTHVFPLKVFLRPRARAICLIHRPPALDISFWTAFVVRHRRDIFSNWPDDHFIMLPRVRQTDSIALRETFWEGFPDSLTDQLWLDQMGSRCDFHSSSCRSTDCMQKRCKLIINPFYPFWLIKLFKEITSIFALICQINEKFVKSTAKLIMFLVKSLSEWYFPIKCKSFVW